MTFSYQVLYNPYPSPVTSHFLIRYFTTATEPHKLLIFPEGTDYDTKTKKRSDAYGDKEGLPHLDYVLHPRTTGITQVLALMYKAIFALIIGELIK